MANYLATRIMEKGEVSEMEGQKYYKTFMSIPKYAKFKDDVDALLMLSGKENLIVELK
ncbi:hypothetical protein [Romboutsia sp. MSSM.1001216sp_RTP31141st1_G3_RTP31141_220114]|uniref:hypothetical protein n=1 Tax=unclassified Romboutsia TaxID=2626894 RepID=UPI0031B61E53